MELSNWKELVLLSVLSFYSILIFWYFFHPIIQYFISHILKSAIFIKFNSQFTLALNFTLLLFFMQQLIKY